MTERRFLKLLEKLTAAGVVFPITRRLLVRYRGVGPEAIRLFQERDLVAFEPLFDELSVRVATELHKEDVHSREEAIGKWGEDVRMLTMTRGWGPCMIAEVRHWIRTPQAKR